MPFPLPTTSIHLVPPPNHLPFRPSTSLSFFSTSPHSPPPLHSLPSHHQNDHDLPFLPFLLCLLSAAFFLHHLPRDFPHRWSRLIASSVEAEAISHNYPHHLFLAVVASEDRGFFRHRGVDPVGIARAVVYFPRGGGGSTITQQLVKNVFLTNERKISRKIVEMVLALTLERRMSKWRILSSYLSMAYWGHGKFGVESASFFYFGKHPSLLTLGESALLAGILPSPELLSPFRDASRGKVSQSKVLRRMVTTGFLDVQSALSIVSQPLYLNYDDKEKSSQLPFSQSQEKDDGNASADQASYLARTNIWDWEMASRSWEARENMEIWASKRKMGSWRKYGDMGSEEENGKEI